MSNTHVIDETAQARRELAAGQYGGHPNAEALIRSHFASVPPEVRSGLRLADNPDALAKAKEADAGKKIKVPDGTRLIDWTVRGTDPRRMVLSYVYETPDGKWHHGVQGYSAEYEAPEESANDRALREVAMHDAHVQHEAALSNADVDEKLAEFRKELEQQQAEHFAKLQDELVSSLKSIVGGASDDEPKKAKATTPKSVPSGKDASSSGESGQGNAEDAPEPDGNAESANEDEGAGEVKWPRGHEGMDALAKSSGLKKSDLPDGWDDMKLPAKQAFLESKGVKPEVEG